MGGFFTWYDPWLPCGTELLVDSGFEVRSDAWSVAGEGVSWSPHDGTGGTGALRIEARPRGGSVQAVIGDPRRFEWMKVRVTVRSQGLVPDDPEWKTGRVLLYFQDEAGQGLWDVPNLVCSVTGTTGWHSCREALRVPQRARRAVLLIQNVARRGTLFADEVSVVPARPSAWLGPLRAGFAVLWVLAALACLVGLRILRRPLGVVMLALFALIAVGTTLPERAIESVTGRVLRGVSGWRAATPSRPATPAAAPSFSSGSATAAPAVRPAIDVPGTTRSMKHAGHFLFFALLAVTAALSERRAAGAERAAPVRRFVLVLFLLALFGAGTEVLQFAAESRTPRLADWTTDVLGVTTGLVVVFLTDRLLNRARSAN